MTPKHRAMAEFVAAFEARNGEITDDEMTQAYRRARSRAVTVRGARNATSSPW